MNDAAAVITARNVACGLHDEVQRGVCVSQVPVTQGEVFQRVASQSALSLKCARAALKQQRLWTSAYRDLAVRHCIDGSPANMDRATGTVGQRYDTSVVFLSSPT